MDDHSEAEEEPHRGRFLTGARPMSSLHRRDPSEEAEADVMPFPEGTAAKPIHIITNPRPFSNSSTGYPSRSEAQSPLPPPPSTSDSSAKEETDPLAGRGHQLPVPALLRVVAVTDNSPHRHRNSRTTSIGHELTSHSFPPNELRGSARSSQSRQHATITGPAPEPWLVPTTHLTSAAVAFTSTELKLPATILPPMLNRKGGRCDVIDGSSSRGRDFDASPKQRRSRSLRSGECRSDCVSGDDRLSRAHSEAVRVEHVAIIGHSPSHLPNAGALRGQSRSPGREGQEHQEQLIRADRQNSTGSNSRDAPQILPPCQPGHSARVHGEASLCLYSPSRADSPVGLPRTLVQEDSSFFYEASQPLASQRQHSCSASASSRPTQPVLTQTNSGTSEDGAGAGRERASRSIPNSNVSGTDNSLRAARAVLKKHYSRAYNTPSGGGGASSSKSERQSKSRKKASEGDSAVSTRDGASGSSQRTPRAGEPVVAFMDQTDRAPSPHHDSQEMTSCSKSSGLSHVHARGTKSSNPTGTSTTSRTNGAEESEGVSVVEKDSPGSGKTESGAAPDSAHPLVEMLELLSPSESQHMMPEVSGTSAPKVSPRAWGGTNRDGIPAPVSTPSHTKNPSMMECSSSEEELYHRSIVDRLALQLTHNSRLFGSSVAQYSTVDADAVFHGVAHNNGGTNSAAGGGGGFVAISPTTTFGGEENIFSAACSMTGWSALGEGCSTDWYAMMRRKNENEGEVNEEAQAEADGTHPPSDPATASTESDAAHPSGHTGLPRLCSARASTVVVALPSVFSQVPSMVVDLPPCLDNDLMQDTLDLMSASVNSSERHQQGGLEPVRRCSTVGPNHDDESDSVVDIFESPERRAHTRASRDGATSRLSVSATTDDIPPITRRDSEVREGGRPHTMHHGTSSGRLNSLARGGRIPSPSRRHSNSSTAIERAPLFEPEPPQSGRGPSSPRIAHSTFRDSPPSHSSILEGTEGGRPEHSVSEATAVARDVLPAALGVEAENNNLASTSSSQKSDVPSPGASRRQPRSKRANRQRMESPNPVPLPSTSPAVAVG